METYEQVIAQIQAVEWTKGSGAVRIVALDEHGDVRSLVADAGPWLRNAPDSPVGQTYVLTIADFSRLVGVSFLQEA